MFCVESAVQRCKAGPFFFVEMNAVRQGYAQATVGKKERNSSVESSSREGARQEKTLGSVVGESLVSRWC